MSGKVVDLSAYRKMKQDIEDGINQSLPEWYDEWKKKYPKMTFESFEAMIEFSGRNNKE